MKFCSLIGPLLVIQREIQPISWSNKETDREKVRGRGGDRRRVQAVRDRQRGRERNRHELQNRERAREKSRGVVWRRQQSEKESEDAVV